MKVLFVAGFGPIVRDTDASRRFYADTLGLDFEVTGDDYLHTDKVDGVKHLGLWPLSQAAQSCFGTSEWPADVPVPQGGIEFEVDDVAGAAAELVERGYQLLRAAGDEPWGQTVARLLSPEGLLVGVVHTPWLHGS